MIPLVLASTSVYRKTLLAQLGLPFDTQAPAFNEETAKFSFQGSKYDLCLLLAQGKAKSLATEQNCVIGSDQMALLDSETLGKPKNKENAIQQLLKMQGRTHELITSVSVFFQNKEVQFLNKTRLKMKPLSTQQIENYLELDLPFDCAGSYKIEKHGISLMDKIETDDFTAIQGLPLIQLAQTLEGFGYQIPKKD